MNCCSLVERSYQPTVTACGEAASWLSPGKTGPEGALITRTGAGPGGRTAAAAVDIPTKLRISAAPASPLAIIPRMLRSDAVRTHLYLFVNTLVSFGRRPPAIRTSELVQDMFGTRSLGD